jgi:hypothetical protein
MTTIRVAKERSKGSPRHTPGSRNHPIAEIDKHEL